MTIDYHTEDEKLQYNVNREAAKISVLSSGKIDYEYMNILKRYEYVTAEKYCHLIKKIIEQANRILSPLIKAIGKQTKTLENQEKKNKLMP